MLDWYFHHSQVYVQCLTLVLTSTTLPCPVTDGVEQDLSGNRLPGSAEDNYRLGLTKFFDTTGGTYALRVDYSYRGDTYSDTFNEKETTLRIMIVVDLSLTYNPNDADWYVSAYIRNLSDSDHIYAKYTQIQPLVDLQMV